MQVEEIEAVDSPEEIKKRIEQIKQTGSARFETRHKRKDGKIIDIEANVNILFQDQPKICCFMRDITDRKQVEDQIRQLNASLEERVAERTRQLSEAQEQLVRNEKLAPLGQLAGGVGHELRNPLGVINSAVYYLKLVQPDADENIKKYHGIIEQEVNTASRIINDLLDFGRIVSPDRQLVSIPDLLQHMLTRFPVPPAVHLQLALPASLPKVFVDPIQLEQVLGNLTTNACQAMRECKDGGSLVISASRKKDQVAISVKDTGTGITPAALQRMFEPLFTTKLRGIGLGLAVSKKLTEANGGSITVRSQPGEGATFTVTLPVKT
jgi:signal transduction histidine kinase